MVSMITRGGIADKAQEPYLDVVIRAGERLWNWLGHILRIGESRLRQILVQCVKPTPNPLFSDDLDPDSTTDISFHPFYIES